MQAQKGKPIGSTRTNCQGVEGSGQQYFAI